MFKKIFTLIICAAIINFFSACSAQNAEKSTQTKEIAQINEKNFPTEKISLNSGYEMPKIGFGTWTLDDNATEDCVFHAIKVGYRLIDTARYYGNEIGVGRGIRRAIDAGIVKREEVFVTSKIMPGNYNSPDAAIENSLDALNIGYIDLMLIHQPGKGDVEVYHALERAVQSGKVRSIGISNYYTPENFDKIKNSAKIVPAVVQNENHPYFQNAELKNYLKNFGTVVESWYPLGGRGNTEKIFADETIQRLSKKYSKSPAQIVLRWQIQDGYIAIPGSKNKNHIAENFDIFDFSLTPDEINEIHALNRNQRFENW